MTCLQGPDTSWAVATAPGGAGGADPVTRRSSPGTGLTPPYLSHLSTSRHVVSSPRFWGHGSTHIYTLSLSGTHSALTSHTPTLGSDKQPRSLLVVSTISNAEGGWGMTRGSRAAGEHRPLCRCTGSTTNTLGSPQAMGLLAGNTAVQEAGSR